MDGWTIKTLVTCVGRQPWSSTWVLGPNVQVASSGNLIPLQQYLWYYNYSYVSRPLVYMTYRPLHLINKHDWFLRNT